MSLVDDDEVEFWEWEVVEDGEIDEIGEVDFFIVVGEEEDVLSVVEEGAEGEAIGVVIEVVVSVEGFESFEGVREEGSAHAGVFGEGDEAG